MKEQQQQNNNTCES